MSDTTDFLARLRAGDEVSMIVETDQGIKVINGTVQMPWSNLRISVGGFTVRDAQGHVDRSIMSIRYIRYS